MPATIRQLHHYRKRSAQRVKATAGTVNVGKVERWLCGVGGGALVAYGVARRTRPGVGLAGVGAALVYRGFSGYCPFYGALGISTAAAPGAAVPSRSPTAVASAWSTP